MPRATRGSPPNSDAKRDSDGKGRNSAQETEHDESYDTHASKTGDGECEALHVRLLGPTVLWVWPVSIDSAMRLFWQLATSDGAGR